MRSSIMLLLLLWTPLSIAQGIASIVSEATCAVEGMPGIMDSSETRCCPLGCGTCGGAGCGSIDMALVAPTVVGDVPEHAKSSAYCCTSGVDDMGVTCGTGKGEGSPPCLIPAPALAEDTCHVEGVEGVSRDGVHCCPLGCGQCGGTGCGSLDESLIFRDPERELPAGAGTSSYCCLRAFHSNTAVCGDLGVEPPCLIPEGTVRPPVVPADGDGDGDDGIDGTTDGTTDGPDGRVGDARDRPAQPWRHHDGRHRVRRKADHGSRVRTSEGGILPAGEEGFGVGVGDGDEGGGFGDEGDGFGEDEEGFGEDGDGVGDHVDGVEEDGDDDGQQEDATRDGAGDLSQPGPAHRKGHLPDC